MQEIVILGAGNVATHLAARLSQVAHVAQVYSRKISNAHELANSLQNCEAIDDLCKLKLDADVYIISLSDTAIPEIAAKLPPISGIVAHTSGSVPIDVIKAENAGVLYPLQTFSKSASLDITKVPFFIEASNEVTRQTLFALAKDIASNATPQYANSAQRKQLHLAAVFACNFANHLWGIADELLKHNGYSLEVLFPLMEATMEKAMRMPPFDVQTGPAARGDLAVIHSHAEMLSDDTKLQELYILLSNHIMNTQK